MATRRNHYVPVWYQKGFASASPPRLHYLDLGPDKFPPPTDAGSARRLQPISPKQCFWSEDLYTTQFFGAPNDEIERFLFGVIDNDGAVAKDGGANPASGYSLIEAKDYEGAVALAKGCPMLAASDRGLSSGSIVIASRQSAQDSINQVGQQLTRRSLNIQPTLSIRPGFPLRIIVNKDLILRPYRVSRTEEGIREN